MPSLPVTLIFLTVTLTVYNFYMFRIEERPELPNRILDRDTMEKKKKSFIAEKLAGKLMGISNLPVIGKINKRLDMAGSPVGLIDFLLGCLVVLIASLVLAFVFAKNNYQIMLGLIFAGVALPHLWLNSKIKNYRMQIIQELPMVIDLLKLTVGAGLDFMLAINRLVKEFKMSPLIHELQVIFQQTQIGKTRREALLGFSERVKVPEISSLVRTLLQAERMGTPISEALKIQSEEIRTRRFQRGEEMALKAPIKLLIPLIIFILPVVLVIVGGPILLQFMKGGFVKI
jgi:tight adherence protein C